MQAFMAVSVALGLVLAGAGSVRAQGYLLYDDFNSGNTTLQAVANMFECTDGPCNNTDSNICVIDEGGPGTGANCFRDLGPVSLGQAVTISIEHQPALDRFQVKRGSTTKFMTYTRPDS